MAVIVICRRCGVKYPHVTESRCPLCGWTEIDFK